MSEQFSGRTFLVTGAASGIGLATARKLAERGARLALWDREADTIAEVGRELNAVFTRAGDIALSDVVHRAMDKTLERLGGQLDGVIHSAGILQTGHFDTTPLDSHVRMVNTNLIGAINVAYCALPALKASRGTLTFLGSAAAFHGGPEYATYGATKAGLLNLAEALRVELAPDGVQVGIANPLFVNTPMIESRSGQSRLLFSKSPLTRVYEPDQVAEAILEGIAKRKFLIWVGRRTRLIYWLSRYGAFSAHRIMRRTWENTPPMPE